MRWIEALKAWNAQRGGMWCVPKKGTPENAEVRAMMGKAEPKAKAKKAKAEMKEEMKAVPIKKKQLKISAEPELVFEEPAPKKKKKQIKISDEPMIDLDEEEKKRRIKAFLKKALEKRRKMKAAAPKAASSAPAAAGAGSVPAPRNLTADQKRLLAMMELEEEGRQLRAAREAREKQEREAKDQKAKARQAERAKSKAEKETGETSLIERMKQVGLRGGGRSYGSSSFSGYELTKDELARRLKAVGEESLKVQMVVLTEEGTHLTRPEIKSVDDILRSLPSNKYVSANFRNTILELKVLDPRELEYERDRKKLYVSKTMTGDEFKAKYGYNPVKEGYKHVKGVSIL